MNKNVKDYKPWIQGQPSPYQFADLTHFPDWGNVIVWDAFFNNLASGLMILAMLTFWSGLSQFMFILPAILTIALVLITVDLGLLILDLGDKWRFFHTLRLMRFTSPLSVGVWGLVSYATFLGVAVIFTWISVIMSSPSTPSYFIGAVASLFRVMAFIGAVVVICYKGVVFSCSSQPGLKDARWLTPFMVSDSLLMGLSLYILITLLFLGYVYAMPLIMPLVVLVFARCITFALLWQDVKARARLIYDKENKIVGISVFIIAGLVGLLLLFAGKPGLFLAALIMLCCGIVERYWLIGLPRPVRLAPTCE